MKRKLVTLVAVCMTIFIIGCTKYDYVKKYEDTAIVKETYTKKIRTNGIYKKRYYTILMYKGDTYKISGREYNEWAQDRIEERININVEDKILGNEVVQRAISIDEYRMAD